jgi:poly(3-hydroxybutyrate) depolymerase
MNKLLSANIDTTGITVSGLSAGAFFANQLLVAYSDVFSGMGAIAGGPYLCAQGTLAGAFAQGLRGDPAPNVDYLVTQTRSLEEHGAVANLKNLEEARIWIFHGTRDETVSEATSDSLVRFCERFTRARNIKVIDDVAVRHAMPSDTFDHGKHRVVNENYITNIGYDAAGNLLQHLYGELKPRTEPKGQIQEFSQADFLQGPRWHGMDQTGFIYLPSGAFEGRQCKLHVALHGCEQYAAKIGQTFVNEAGYNGWAEANDIVVLYPQTFPTVTWMVYNPKGCWDWFGLDDSQYFSRAGRQQRAIVKMVERLAGQNLTH